MKKMIEADPVAFWENLKGTDAREAFIANYPEDYKLLVKIYPRYMDVNPANDTK